jgi:hypothetical protein
METQAKELTENAETIASLKCVIDEKSQQLEELNETQNQLQ